MSGNVIFVTKNKLFHSLARITFGWLAYYESAANASDLQVPKAYRIVEVSHELTDLSWAGKAPKCYKIETIITSV